MILRLACVAFLLLFLIGCNRVHLPEWRDTVWKVDYIHMEASSQFIQNIDEFYGAELIFNSCPEMVNSGAGCDFLAIVEGESFVFNYLAVIGGSHSSVEIRPMTNDTNRGDVYKKLRSLLSNTFVLEWHDADLTMQCRMNCRATYQGRIYQGLTIAASKAP